MRRLPHLALAAALALTACGDAEDPVVVDSDTVTVDVAPPADAGAVEADVPLSDEGEAVAPEAAAPETAAPETAPPPPAPAPALAEAAASGLSAVTFFNNTGMSISHLYVAGCDESEGSDWNDMRSWAQERLQGDALDPDESRVIEYADGCYVAEPHYVGEGPISEKVIVDGPTRVDFTIG